MSNTLMLLGFVVFVILLVAGLVWRRARSTFLYCPVREQIVEMKGEQCLATDGDQGVVGSIWDCQRQCLDEPEVRAAMRDDASGKRG
jgi:hypothetical protein